MLRSYRSRRSKERLRTGHRGCIEAAGKCAAGSALDRVVSASHACDRVENDHDILAELYHSTRALEHHLGDVSVTSCRHVEARCDNFAVTPRNQLAHFFGTLVNEQHEKNCLRMIHCNA